MGAEMWITFAIFAYVAMMFVVLGIVQLRSKKPVGFWSGEKPPAPSEVTDMRAYNRAHGWMWIGYAIAMILSFLIGILIDNGWLMAILVCGASIGGAGVMIAVHQHLYHKYVRKSGK